MDLTHRTSRLRVASLLAGLALAGSTMSHPTAQAASSAKAIQVEASWEMSEPSGATTMVDSGPNGLHATVNPSGVTTGFVFDGATGYQWYWRNPTAPPASPERVIQIPDNPALDPRGDTFTIEIRYRTRNKFGNITQKGQATTPGGQFKIQNPGGMPECLFKGSLGQGGVRTPTPINDNRWHVLRCVKTATYVDMYVDGVRVGRKNGAVGYIDNNWEWVIGGKSRCDQIRVTCDYFSGEIDYVRVYRGS